MKDMFHRFMFKETKMQTNHQNFDWERIWRGFEI